MIRGDRLRTRLLGLAILENDHVFEQAVLEL
jgi:hypothetical protein